MVKILIVDDENSRVREICAEIDIDGVNIDLATTKIDGIRRMTETQYDLVIIDIMLPADAKTVMPSKKGGIELIHQIEATRRIMKPLNIIGLTAGTDVYESFKSFFESKMIPLFLWTNSNADCKTALKNKIEYLIKIDKQKTNHIKADIAIVTAVEVEFLAAKALYDNWQTVEFPNDSTIYQYTIANINDSPKTIVLAMLPEMGMTAASCFTTKILQLFHPNQVYMIGICGGIKGEVELTDLIVASSTWDYGSGKIKPKLTDNTYYELEPSPNQIGINASIGSEIRTYKDEIISQVIFEWNSLHPEATISPKVYLSPMPSGSAVICDEAVFSELIRPQHRKCVGLDMETYGVYFASSYCLKETVDFLSIKSVSDFANIEKNDDYHSTCCFISSRFLKKFLEIHNAYDEL
jgi:nucleoside phosphorylase/CheY-like chemotaxis protein